MSNLAAFLTTISISEGTSRVPDSYRCCYGYAHTIANLGDHPFCTGEWHGEPLDSLGPEYVGKFSTAAGRYQINWPTWEMCKRALHLENFEPPSQDAAATFLIKQKGALDAVITGHFEDAVGLCRGVWASLPGGNSGQPEHALAELQQAYTDAGGALA